jgi:cytidylate kinase
MIDKKLLTIAIDGYSSCGKSTLAKALAQKLGYVFIDSGAMYRGVTLFAIEQGIIQQGELNEKKLLSKLNEISLGFKFNPVSQHSDLYLNNVNVEYLIRQPEVASYVSKIAAISQVRAKLVHEQQVMGKSGGIVMDGRDIGTVVFPNAEVKFFVTALPEIRAERRFKELREKGNNTISLEEVKSNLILRDELDSTRTESPLIKAEDAFLIDTSTLSREEQLHLALQEIEKRLF